MTFQSCCAFDCTPWIRLVLVLFCCGKLSFISLFTSFGPAKGRKSSRTESVSGLAVVCMTCHFSSPSFGPLFLHFVPSMPKQIITSVIPLVLALDSNCYWCCLHGWLSVGSSRTSLCCVMCSIQDALVQECLFLNEHIVGCDRLSLFIPSSLGGHLTGIISFYQLRYADVPWLWSAPQ